MPHLRSLDVLGGVRCDSTVDARERHSPHTVAKRRSIVDAASPALYHVMQEQFDVRARRCEHLEADRLRPDPGLGTARD